MKIGIITDIHNNMEALKVILEKLDEDGCEKLICCGDMIGIGPDPEETVAFLRKQKNIIACVQGNHESYLTVFEQKCQREMGMEEAEVAHHAWEQSLLSEASKSFLKALPFEETVTIGGKRIYVSHYAMEEVGRYKRYVPAPTEEQLEELFEGVSADIILYGHDHAPHVVMGEKVYINCGSLGCPGRDKNIARAGILAIEDGKIDFQPVQITYDVETVLNQIDELQYPDYISIKKYFYSSETTVSSGS